MKTITKEQAKAEGYRPLTTAYTLPQEEWMLNNIVADLRRGNINFALVAEDDVRVWNRALSEKEIAALFNDGPTGVEVWKQ